MAGEKPDPPWTVWKKYFVHTKRTQFPPRVRQDGGEVVGRGKAQRAPSPSPTSTPPSPRQGGAAPGGASLRSCPLCEAVGRRAPRHRPATCRLLTEPERAKVAVKTDDEVAKMINPTFIKQLKRRLDTMTSALDAAK